MRAKYVSIVCASGRGVSERWMSRYGADGNWMITAMGDSRKVYDKLCALGPNPSPQAAAEAIGNESWTHVMCDGCSDYVMRAVAIGSEFCGTPKNYCATCVAEAASLLPLGAEV